MVGARVLALYGAGASVAGASVVVDLTLEVLTQFVFTVLGLALLVGSVQYNGTVRALAIGLLIAMPMLLGFVLAQRWGLFSLFERFLERIADRRPALGLDGLAGLHDAIQELYGNFRRVAWSSTLHLLSWVLTSTEVWVALLLMGHPATFRQALVLQSLSHAVRSAAFLIPSGLGAQEAGFIVLGSMYGLPPEVGLAVSLAIRLREVVLGVPALLFWPFLEGRRVLANR
jgi:putative membrane protein